MLHRTVHSTLNYVVSSRNCHPQPYIWVGVLEGTLFRFDGWVPYSCHSMSQFERFFGAESIIDKALEVHNIGGVYGNQRPTEFLCLLLKLLQIQPEKEILVEYLQADEFKCVSRNLVILNGCWWKSGRYLRALSAMYIRLTFRAVDVYEMLEPLLKDYRKLRNRDMGTPLTCLY